MDRSAANLICLPWYVRDFFSLAAFMIVSLPEYFVNLSMKCLVDGQFLLNLMGGPLCFLDFDVCVFPQVKKVFRYDLLT